MKGRRTWWQESVLGVRVGVGSYSEWAGKPLEGFKQRHYLVGFSFPWPWGGQSRESLEVGCNGPGRDGGAQTRPLWGTQSRVRCGLRGSHRPCWGIGCGCQRSQGRAWLQITADPMGHLLGAFPCDLSPVKCASSEKMLSRAPPVWVPLLASHWKTPFPRHLCQRLLVC